MTQDAWVLQLKEEISNEHFDGEILYLAEDFDEELTDDLNRAEIYYDKEEIIEFMKEHDAILIREYGENSIRNFGWENISKNFNFVEVTVDEESESE